MRMRIVAASLACAALLTACSDEPGTPAPGGDAGQASGPAEGQPANGLPHSGAPKVENPIDTTKWENDPCALIDAGKIAAAGFPAPEVQRKQDEIEGTVACRGMWVDLLSSFTASLSLDAIEDGLSHFYAKDAAGDLEAFEPLEPIEGYPAIVAMTDDLRKNGECDVDVGLRDDSLFTVQMNADSDSPWYDDPCKAAQEIAAVAVQTMKGGA